DMQRMVKISQIESRNPHLHEVKGDEHVEDMIAASLSTIYHSKLCPESLREEIERELRHRDYLKGDEQLAPMRIYKSLDRMKFDSFNAIAGEALALAGRTTVRVPVATSRPTP